MMKLRNGCILALLCLLAACAANKNDEFLDSVAARPTAALLTGTDWQIISAHTFTKVLNTNFKKDLDDLLPASGARATVSFAPGGSFNIKGGCNTQGGSWSLSADKLKTSPPVSTLMACDEELMKLDAAAGLVFSDKISTVRVLNGVGNSLIRLQTNDDIYIVMKALAKVKQNNSSYAGKYYDDILGNYEWTLTKNKSDWQNLLGNLPLASNARFEFNRQTLTVKAGCGTLTFNTAYNEDRLNIGALTNATGSCAAGPLAAALTAKNFKIAGELLGKKPKITLTDTADVTLTLKGKIKAAETEKEEQEKK